MILKPIREKVANELCQASQRVMDGDRVVRIVDAQTIADAAAQWGAEWARRDVEENSATMSENAMSIARIAGYLLALRGDQPTPEKARVICVQDAMELVALATEAARCLDEVKDG